MLATCISSFTYSSGCVMAVTPAPSSNTAVSTSTDVRVVSGSTPAAWPDKFSTDSIVNYRERGKMFIPGRHQALAKANSTSATAFKIRFRASSSIVTVPANSSSNIHLRDAVRPQGGFSAISEPVLKLAAYHRSQIRCGIKTHGRSLVHDKHVVFI